MILAGALSGLFFALPAAIAQRTVFDGGVGSLLMLGVIFFAGALAGYGAARPLPTNPLMHGAAAGAITFVGAQLVYSIAERTPPNPLGFVFFVLMFASLGSMGAWVAVSTGGRRIRGEM